ncbi:hypothetical protein FQ185_28510 [Pseudomonas sp. ANT_H12B]|nr:hypothetical protein FQ185_28510 [Pseudomonas sp. ANT_H12B]
MKVVYEPPPASVRLHRKQRACSRWRLVIQHSCRLTHRDREQARSHRGIVSGLKIKPPADPAPDLHPTDATGTASASMQRRCPGC